MIQHPSCKHDLPPVSDRNESDHLVVLKVIEMWDQLRSKHRSVKSGRRHQQNELDEFCASNCLDIGALFRIEEMRSKLKEVRYSL